MTDEAGAFAVTDEAGPLAVTDEAGAFAAAAVRVAAGGDHRAEAAALVGRMTTEEKLWCLDGDTEFWPGLVDLVGGGYHRHPWPAAAVPRFGIPGIRFADGPRGCVIGPATCFPVSMARGATFDPALEERIGAAIGTELRAMGATYTGAVCMNLLRHPGWGRAQETYGEDPHHVGEMAAALTRGLQRHVLACMKHFACNSMEEPRFRIDVRVGERALHEVYLPHFRRVADEGVASVMSAYNAVNGTWCGEHRVLLTDVLRAEWGWDGFVTSDFVAGVHDAVRSVEAGLEIEMPFRQVRAAGLPAALLSGELHQADVDARVVATVATLLRFAHVFGPGPGAEVLAAPGHRALAREAAVTSTVLLRNAGGLLPVGEVDGRLAVLGRLAAVPNLGDGGSSDVYPPEVVTLLDGLREGFPRAEVVHATDDARVAAGADLAVVVVGCTRADEGEFVDVGTSASMATRFPSPPDPSAPPGPVPASTAPEGWTPAPAAGPSPNPDGGAFAPGGDRRSLRLSEGDEVLVRAVASVCPRTVAVVMGGSAVVAPWLEEVPATLLVWYPGMEGGRALADLLTGAAEPGGRLPFALPADEADLVAFDPDADTADYDLFHGQWKLDRDGTAPARPFGFGLGYTTWVVDPASVQVAVPVGDGVGTVEAEVTNGGDRPGATVLFLFGGRPDSAVDRPARRLVGFRRVTLPAGGRAVVRLPFDLATLDVRRDGGWWREPGPYRLEVAWDAASTVATLDVDVRGGPAGRTRSG